MKLRLVDAEEPQGHADELLVGESTRHELSAWTSAFRRLVGAFASPSSSQMRQMGCEASSNSATASRMRTRCRHARRRDARKPRPERARRGPPAVVRAASAPSHRSFHAFPNRLGRETQALPRSWLRRRTSENRPMHANDSWTTCAHGHWPWSTRYARSSRRSRRRAIHVPASRVQRSWTISRPLSSAAGASATS